MADEQCCRTIGGIRVCGMCLTPCGSSLMPQAASQSQAQKCLRKSTRACFRSRPGRAIVLRREVYAVTFESSSTFNFVVGRSLRRRPFSAFNSLIG